jgi:hypothetical protein
VSRRGVVLLLSFDHGQVASLCCECEFDNFSTLSSKKDFARPAKNEQFGLPVFFPGLGT